MSEHLRFCSCCGRPSTACDADARGLYGQGPYCPGCCGLGDAHEPGCLFGGLCAILAPGGTPAIHNADGFDEPAPRRRP